MCLHTFCVADPRWVKQRNPGHTAGRCTATHVVSKDECSERVAIWLEKPPTLVRSNKKIIGHTDLSSELTYIRTYNYNNMICWEIEQTLQSHQIHLQVASNLLMSTWSWVDLEVQQGCDGLRSLRVFMSWWASLSASKSVVWCWFCIPQKDPSFQDFTCLSMSL